MKKMLKILCVLCACVMCISTLVCAQGEEGCAHNYGGWNIKQAATCTANGVRVRICEKCGDVQSETISATGHSYGGWNTKKAATCTTSGERVRICGSCGDVQKETISAAGHSYGEWNTKKEPTCTASGERVRICKDCGDVQSETISATGHSYGGWNTKKAATCTANGERVRICGSCGDVQTETIDKLAHKTVKLPGKAATCTETGLTEGEKCSVCGETLKAQSTIAALGHKPEKLAGKAATCTEDGLTDGEKCSVCDKVLKAQNTIAALGHTSEIVPGKAATCTEDGLTDGEKCSVCDEILTEQQVVPATGHQYESTKIAATTSSKGYTLHTCALCGDSYKDNWTAKLRAKQTKKAVPARTEAPKAEILDSIVTDAEGNPLQYADHTEPHEQDCDLLVIIADMDADTATTIRNLHLSPELLADLKTDGVGYIRFVVGDAAVEFPLDMFESEEIALILQNMESEFMGYVISVNPDAQNAENELGCQVQVYLATADASEEDITAFAQGMKLIIGENTLDIAAN